MKINSCWSVVTVVAGALVTGGFIAAQLVGAQPVGATDESIAGAAEQKGSPRFAQNHAVRDVYSLFRVTSQESGRGQLNAVLDAEQDPFSLSQGGRGVGHESGLDASLFEMTITRWDARLSFEPILNQVILSLPPDMRPTFSWSDPQDEDIHAIDPISSTDPMPSWVPLDPWQILPDGTGFIFTANTSKPWTVPASLVNSSSTSSANPLVRREVSLGDRPALSCIYGAAGLTLGTCNDASSNRRPPVSASAGAASGRAG